MRAVESPGKGEPAIVRANEPKVQGRWAVVVAYRQTTGGGVKLVRCSAMSQQAARVEGWVVQHPLVGARSANSRSTRCRSVACAVGVGKSRKRWRQE